MALEQTTEAANELRKLLVEPHLDGQLRRLALDRLYGLATRGRDPELIPLHNALSRVLGTIDYRTVLATFKTRYGGVAFRSIPPPPGVTAARTLGIFRCRRDPAFRDQWSQLIRTAKCGDKPTLDFLAAMLAACWEERCHDWHPVIDFIVPVPNSPTRGKIKGVGVTAYLAERLAGAVGLPIRRRTLRRLSGVALT